MTLKSELVTDPANLGYAVLDDQAAANVLNVRDRSYVPDSITGAQLIGVIDATEFAGLSAADKVFVQMAVSSGGELDTSAGSLTLAQLRAIFAVGSPTRANLLATFKRSRAEELGLGVVTRRDVAIARRA